MLKIFVLEDDELFSRMIQKTLEKTDDREVFIFNNGTDFLDSLSQKPDITTIDYNLPDYTGIDILKKVKSYDGNICTILLSGQENPEVVVEAYKSGADAYIVKNDNALIELEQNVKKLAKNIELHKQLQDLQEQVVDREKYYKIIGESAAILQVLKMIQKVEKNNILVLITGESGTGKELVAKAIHYNSPRKRKPFIAVNMAAIPEDLIESELFGHEKGAFTGAISKRIGKFEEANGGTIFLDEIGEMDVNLQTKLLRVLQENKITRVGSNKEIKLDLRVIAATNKDLSQQVREGKFREDLYYRLQGFLIDMPPLRERDNDVVILSKYFLQHFADQNKIKKSISPPAMEKLINHSWPGNIRELKSVIERAALISDSEVIAPDDILFSDKI